MAVSLRAPRSAGALQTGLAGAGMGRRGVRLRAVSPVRCLRHLRRLDACDVQQATVAAAGMTGSCTKRGSRRDRSRRSPFI
ncbi:hypothetical protein XAC3810_110028 [Xanthomonas citri pv. citri]|uniref:Uncharacterized protein n=1 Tax=Xanthomonas citri pv. citri TaxID=611301 RepID=A0A0U5FB95_XANCI|nr:hypothetical protein XAR_1891 [Xanthomonas citri pv. glycines str. 8ra]CEE16150.1 hypothetical protein XAC3824_120220 [Xanthomonas citri pv. citri]CEE17102.1 hypothetical protein XAC9322_120037 [Xanthomonas citri pv. citri]CEE18156.1 hypothetical protein XAC1083_130027 [Xanthomonas citri pv. citri]CEE23527.1 hypothetical protein XAC3810_110028 [Xanthomonas citri pv. citri]